MGARTGRDNTGPVWVDGPSLASADGEVEMSGVFLSMPVELTAHWKLQDLLANCGVLGSIPGSVLLEPTSVSFTL